MGSAQAAPSISRAQAWLLAARPRTLYAAAGPVVIASAVAWYEGMFDAWLALAALAAALLLQIGANLANDVFDFQRGADRPDRLGPPRATQMGWLSPREVMAGMWVVFGAAALIGLCLVWVGGWPILLIGVLSILFAILYSAGPFPLSVLGLGDLFAFLAFGLAAVCGTYYVQAHTVSPLASWASLPMGLLVTAILVVNNLRDIEQDRAVGKHTMAVRFGAGRTQVEYILLLVVAFTVPLVLWLTGQGTPWLLTVWLAVPNAQKLVSTLRTQTGRALNPALGGTGQLVLIYALLWGLGLWLERFVSQ